MKRKKPRHRLTETEIAHARRLLASGVPRKTIATALEVSYSTLYLALKPYSAGPYPQMGRPKQAPHARAAFAEEVFKATISNANTKRAYIRSVAQFLDWCEQSEVELRQITPGLAGRYISQLAVSAATKSQTLTPLRHFFDTLVTRHTVALNPFASGISRSEKSNSE
jgi:hypothetical protein